MKSRIRPIKLAFIIWAFVLVSRLFYWQVVKAEELKDQAQFQQTNRLLLPGSRGNILASDGFPFVTNAPSYLLYFNPSLLKDISQLEAQLKDLPASQSALVALKSGLESKLQYVILAKELNQAQKDNFESLKISGLGFEAGSSRIYPEGSSSAYITGFVGKNENDEPEGYFGLEGYYNRELSGTSGRIVEEKDAFGMPIVIGSHLRIPAQPGSSLQTSIDRVVQHIAYSKLVKGIEKFQAASGTVTILDSKTSEVLAFVSWPGYDPVTYGQFDSSLYKNPIVADTYEPGSIFKPIVMASGLDAGVITPNSTCSNCSGPLIISGHSVRNYDDKYYKDTSMTDIILHSDNVGMVFVAKKLGKEKFLDYLKKFGIGRLTGIDVQEESSGNLRPDNEWYEIDWSTASFGQGIAVTPIQMTTAINCLARRGECKSPSIVKKIISNSSTQELSSSETWKVVSEKAASEITNMMVYGVDNGPVKAYKPQGYKIAGKTGTAQVPIEGYYDETKTIASFVGFAPVPDPKFTMLVTVREPKTSPWGSTTAAPIWFEIATELLRYFNIPSGI